MGEVEEEQGFDLREALNFVWREWKFVASVLGLALIVTAIFLVKQTPYYDAAALVLVDLHAKTSPIGDENKQPSGTTDAEIENQMAIIKSVRFLRRVVEKQRLVNDPEFGSKAKPDGQISIFEKIRTFFSHSNASTEAGSEASETEPPNGNETASIDALGKALSVKREGLGSILSITVTSVDPSRAARLANAVANAFIVEKLDARFDAAKRASAWLDDRLVGLRKQLRDSEQAVVDFREQHGLNESAPDITLNDQQLSEINEKLVQARTDLAQKKARLDVLRSIMKEGGSIQNLPALAGESDMQALASLRSQEVAISQKEVDLELRYSARHPLVVNIRAQHRDIERQFSEELKRLEKRVENEYELAKARVGALQDSIQEATGQGGGSDKVAVTLHELERTATINKNLFDNVLKKAKITQQQATFDAEEARVITPATPPVYPAYPNMISQPTCRGNGRVDARSWRCFREGKLNSGFTTPRQVERVLDLPLLASIPRVEFSEMTKDNQVVEIPTGRSETIWPL